MNDEATSPTAAARFDRDANVPADWSPGKHAALSLAISGAIVVAAALLARRAQPVDWLFLPVFWLAGNALEWTFHKGPMHRPLGPRVLYHNHTLIHHRAFLPATMPIRHARDLGLILMPWYTMLLLFVLASPIALFAWALRGPGTVGIFYLFAVAYYLSYEGLHGLYHTSVTFQSKLGLDRNRVFQALLSHHRHHHRLDRMAHVNFNVTLPLMDTLMGTREREERISSSVDTRMAGG